MTKLTKNIIVILLLGIIVLVSSCSQSLKEENTPRYGVKDSQDTIKLSVEDDSFKKINSEEELFNLMIDAALNSNDEYSSSFSNQRFAQEGGMALEIASDSSVSSKSASVDQSASEVSSTNVQVEGVDESDIVKTDGTYIYSISNSRVMITKAYPSSDAELLSSIKFENTIRPQEMFLYENKLVVIATSYENSYGISHYTLLPQREYFQKTTIFLYDVSNKEDITLEKEYGVSGNFNTARMIEDQIYIVNQESVSYSPYPRFPIILEDGISSRVSEIYYYDIQDNSQFNTISTIDLESNEFSSQSFLLDYGSTIYSSKNNLYIAFRNQFTIDPLDRFEKVVLPLLNSTHSDYYKLNSIDKSKEELHLLSKEVFEMEYTSLDEEDKNNLIRELNDKLSEYEAQMQERYQTTHIHKFKLNKGSVDHVAQGEIKGNLLNQFSLDEYDEYLRVATTTSFWVRGEGRVSYNNVYVLNSNLENVGSLEKLAEDERIYSTRFMGEKLYMVTFKQVDPLFVIDLKDPTSPKVEGELKIPGFSNYLHPYKEGYLIGVGQDTKESQWGGIITTGVKISLFDVRDVNNPKEVDSFVVKGRWTSSEVSNDHKAFLLHEDRGIVAIPIVGHTSTDDDASYYDGEYVRGAYIFSVDEDEGINLEKEIHHISNEDGNWYYNSPYTVRRSLYLDNVLYTVSEGKILLNDMNNSFKEVGEVDLNYEVKNDGWDYVYY